MVGGIMIQYTHAKVYSKTIKIKKPQCAPWVLIWGVEMNNKIMQLVLLALLVPIFIISQGACNTNHQVSFGIYLADTGDLVLSQEHIKAYYGIDHSMELNEKGIARWNSYHTYTDIPKLKESLYQKDFIIKTNDREICRGKFYSMLSSASYSGIAIIDAVMPLDNEHNKIWVISDYPNSTLGVEYDDISSELASVFEELNLLR
jgi:hypothetical protein